MLKTFSLVCLSFLIIIVTDFVRCEPDYVLNLKADVGLKLYSTPLVWEEALVRCLNDGAVLASPLNKQLADALRTQMAQFGVNGHIFLGTHALNDKEHFASVEGVLLSDMDITLGSHRNGKNTGDCLTMSVDGSAYYSSCKDSLPFICYKKLVNHTISECGTFDNEYQLNQQTGSCYKVHLNKTSWPHAYSTCASEGSHLVILNDEEEARIVQNMFPAPPKNVFKWDGFHIGLRSWGKEHVWTTIHGERLEDVYNKWEADQPDTYGDRVVYLWNGNLDDINGVSELRMFACEKSPKPKQLEDTMGPQTTKKKTK